MFGGIIVCMFTCILYCSHIVQPIGIKGINVGQNLLLMAKV